MVEVANANETLVLDGPESFVLHSELALLKLAEWPMPRSLQVHNVLGPYGCSTSA